MSEPEDEFFDEDEEIEEEPEQPQLTAEEIEAAFVAAEDAEDFVDSEEADFRRRIRFAWISEQFETYLSEHPDGWQPWPQVVAAIEGKPIAEISPRNAGIRQVALRYSQSGRIEIKLGKTCIFEAIRLIPRGE